MFKVFLLVLTGPLRGHKYLVKTDSSILVGRSPDADINISYDNFCSRKHAVVYRENDGFFIEDLGSTNGTFVNGGKVIKKVNLSDGDIIEFGGTRIVLRIKAGNA